MCCLQVSLTAKFFQTMQDFFFPKSEGDGPDPLEPDHSHLFGVHRTQDELLQSSFLVLRFLTTVVPI